MEGIIYVITNKINGKQYVGQTRRSLYLRFYEHCQQQKSESSIHKRCANGNRQTAYGYSWIKE